MYQLVLLLPPHIIKYRMENINLKMRKDPNSRLSFTSIVSRVILMGQSVGKNEEMRIRRSNRCNFLILLIICLLREEREQLQNVFDNRWEKRDFKFIVGTHVSLIKISSKGLELLYEITVLHSVYCFSPDTSQRLVHNGHILNGYLWSGFLFSK